MKDLEYLNKILSEKENSGKFLSGKKKSTLQGQKLDDVPAVAKEQFLCNGILIAARYCLGVCNIKSLLQLLQEKEQEVSLPYKERKEKNLLPVGEWTKEFALSWIVEAASFLLEEKRRREEQQKQKADEEQMKKMLWALDCWTRLSTALLQAE